MWASNWYLGDINDGSPGVSMLGVKLAKNDYPQLSQHQTTMTGNEKNSEFLWFMNSSVAGRPDRYLAERCMHAGLRYMVER